MGGRAHAKKRNSSELIKTGARFWANVEETPSGCWVWKGGKMSSGYGHLRHEGRLLGAHRFSFLLHKGELSPGMVICHTCHNRACVRPSHIYQGTYQDNADDAVDKRRLEREEKALAEEIDNFGGYDLSFWEMVLDD